MKTLSSTIQSKLDKILQWLNANKLSINASKTKIVIFKCKNKPLDSQITIKINDDIIKQVPFVKFLGVTIDQKLTWINHINSVLKSITKSTGMIAKLRHTNKNTMKLIYYALARLHSEALPPEKCGGRVLLEKSRQGFLAYIFKQQLNWRAGAWRYCRTCQSSGGNYFL